MSVHRHNSDFNSVSWEKSSRVTKVPLAESREVICHGVIVVVGHQEEGQEEEGEEQGEVEGEVEGKSRTTAHHGWYGDGVNDA